jgi:hypothetical protein
MKPQPLKNKLISDFELCLLDDGLFHERDIKSAVKWLKEKISHDGFSYDLINKAFEDVTKEVAE